MKTQNCIDNKSAIIIHVRNQEVNLSNAIKTECFDCVFCTHLLTEIVAPNILPEIDIFNFELLISICL